MAKKEKAEPQETSKEANEITKNTLKALLDGNKTDHYNYVEQISTKVTSGSLFLDAGIALTEGVHRFCGVSGAGKTSEAAEVVRNFLNGEKRGKALWVKAEGRLGENVVKRSGVKFVFKQEEWDYGTCFVLESNTFEFICEMISAFVESFRELGDKLAIVIDSVDGLKLKSDKNNALTKEKTAGPQLLMKRFLKEAYYPIVKNGVICIAISQVTSTIAKDDYAPPALTSGGGGNALLHWSSYILEFQGKNWGDNILKDGPNTKFDKEKNPIIGHNVRVVVKKGDKENEGITISYPIKHGRQDGNSIWKEQEIIFFGKRWGLIETSGAWYSLEKSIKAGAEEELKIQIPEKVQGQNNFLLYLESQPALVQFLFDKIRSVEGK